MEMMSYTCMISRDEDHIINIQKDVILVMCQFPYQVHNCCRAYKELTENIIEYLSSMMKPISTYGTKQHIILYVCQGYCSIVKTLYVKIMHAHMCSPFFVDV